METREAAQRAESTTRLRRAPSRRSRLRRRARRRDVRRSREAPTTARSGGRKTAPLLIPTAAHNRPSPIAAGARCRPGPPGEHAEADGNEDELVEARDPRPRRGVVVQPEPDCRHDRGNTGHAGQDERRAYAASLGERASERAPRMAGALHGRPGPDCRDRRSRTRSPASRGARRPRRAAPTTGRARPREAGLALERRARRRSAVPVEGATPSSARARSRPSIGRPQPQTSARPRSRRGLPGQAAERAHRDNRGRRPCGRDGP